MASGVIGISDYELIQVPSDRIDREMRIAGDASGIPEALQGLWWMDGNPLPDEVISLGNSTWAPESRMTWIQVYGERIWSWHSNLQGRLLYAQARVMHLVYELRFNEDLTFGTITPLIGIGGYRARVPESLVKFIMRLERDGLWRRESWFFGTLYHAYDLRRIVRGDGAREDAFAAYAKSAPARSLLAVRRRGA